MVQWKWHVLLAGIVGLGLLAGGCVGRGAQETALASRTAMPSVQVATKTAFPAPVRTATLTPSRTLLATLPAEEAQRALLALYADNGGCELPCWWGITPGETRWEEAYERLAPLGDVFPMVRNGVEQYEFQFVVPEELSSDGYIWPTIWVKDGVVTAIGLNAGWISKGFDYSLSGLLKRFGKPEEIWVQPIVDGPPEWPAYYDIDLFYPSQGLNIDASGEAYIRNGILPLCFQTFSLGLYPPAILLWKPREGMRFETYRYELLGGFQGEPSLYPSYRLAEMSEFDEQDFFEAYRDPESEVCIEVEVSRLSAVK